MKLTDDLRKEYQGLWETMVLFPAKITVADYTVSRILPSKGRYEEVAARTGVPWYFIAIVHSLEGGLSFRTHLHNGDPLNARTVRVPRGRPVSGSPPFTWEASAEDALRYEGLTQWNDWSIPGLLFRLELFNGWGYRNKGVRSPYLWSFSNHYSAGKFVRDHVYDPKAVSAQIGAAVLLRRLADHGHVKLDERIKNAINSVADVGETGGPVPVVGAGGVAGEQDPGPVSGDGEGNRGSPDGGGIRVAVPPATGSADEARGQVVSPASPSLNDQLLNAANVHAGLQRFDRGYQGRIIEVRQPIVVIPVLCEDGQERYIEPRESRFAFVRDRIEIGVKPGMGITVNDFLRIATRLAGLGALLLLVLW